MSGHNFRYTGYSKLRLEFYIVNFDDSRAESPESNRLLNQIIIIYGIHARLILIVGNAVTHSPNRKKSIVLLYLAAAKQYIIDHTWGHDPAAHTRHIVGRDTVVDASAKSGTEGAILIMQL